MYASSMVQYLFAYGLILYRGGTTYAKPLQITETQLLSLSNDSSETNSYNPWSMANDSSLSLNVSNPDNSEIRCERYKYGFIDDEVLVDCGKALPYMVDSSEINFVEDREMQGNVVCLPYRIYGNRGTCYFEMGLMEGKTSAIAMMDQVRIAAISLSRQCGKRFQGGIATSLGDGNLTVIMGRYALKPQCRGAISEENLLSCATIAFHMPAGAQILLFGPASDSRTQVEIPLQIKAHSCSLTIYSTTQTPARSSNYEVWQALSALMSVCARQDKGGSVAGLGEDGSIFVTLRQTAAVPGIEVSEYASLPIVR